MKKFKEPILEKILRYIRVKEVISHLGDSKIICDIGCGFNAYFLSKVKNIIVKLFTFKTGKDLTKVFFSVRILRALLPEHLRRIG